MKKTTILISSLAIAGVIFVSASSFVNSNEVTTIAKNNIVICDSCGKDPETTLKTNMRKLWEDHITWTRNVIFCLADDLPGGDQATTRLLKNQDDIGDAIKPYYGADAGKKLSALLHDHITIAAEVIKDARANDKPKLDDANKRWSANAKDIVDFLSKANPKWKEHELKKMMDDHLKLTTDEVVARIKKDYDADVASYDKVHEEILKMADMLTDGIVQQFPDKFAKKAKGKSVANK